MSTPHTEILENIMNLCGTAASNPVADNKFIAGVEKELHELVNQLYDMRNNFSDDEMDAAQSALRERAETLPRSSNFNQMRRMLTFTAEKLDDFEP